MSEVTFKCENCDHMVTNVMKILYIGEDFNTDGDTLYDFPGSFMLCDNCHRTALIALKERLPGLEGL